ncbi:MAG: class I SAM-dependent rRNA methyltransferase [Elusimicrobiales bacterium]|jgi:23S rRNA (cytosine1962-C5)-methyltransferase|nr:class I SAM-dependent rRNA methyltransferase [Elusimicrobiales bacterium]HPO95192.1 class I SAM-dependent rRNA methyltransferase [Elusimicrobiales bacterium]
MKTIKLKENYIERLNTHLWIFSNEIEKHDFSAENGEIVKIEYSDGKTCGIGFYNPHSLISVRLLTLEEKLSENFLEEKIKKAYLYRNELEIEDGRMFFGESDGIGGLVIDKYGDVITMEILSAGVEKLKEDIMEVVKKIFLPKAIVVIKDHPYRMLEGLKIEQPEIIGKMPKSIIIEENGAKFQIDILNSQKTGWYYDQRDNREFLKPYFKGRKVLDLYCYAGAFSIIAAKNKAKMVWGVDSSEKAIEMAEKNKKLNKIPDSKLIFKKESAQKILDALLNKELPETPDFILLDPPNFVRNKKHLFEAKRLYIRLLKSAIKGVDKEGLVAFSTCSQHVSDEVFSEIIQTAANKARRKLFIINIGTQSKDHPILAGMKETKYLRFSLLKVLD